MTPTYGFDRFLNVRSAYAPCFSLDGSYVTFIADITGIAQAWSVRHPGEWPTQVTFGPDRVFCAVSDARSDRWVIAGDIGGDERVQLQLLDAASGVFIPLTSRPDVIHNVGGWSPDGRQIAITSNERNPSSFDVYVLDVQGGPGERRMVFQADGSVSVAAWSPTGDALLIHETLAPFNHNLYLLPLDGGEPELLTPHTGDARYEAVQWSPDGRSLYLVTDESREFMALARLDLRSRAWEALVSPDWDVYGCALTRDGKRLAYLVNAAGYSELHVRELASGKELQPAGLPRGVIPTSSGGDTADVPAIVWSPDGCRLAFNLSGPARNLDVWQWDVDSGQVQPLTRSGTGGLPRSAFCEPELVSYETFDGREIPAFFYVPQGREDRPVPCIFYVHGGPESQLQATFNPLFQYFVHRGYAVFAPNVRGSTGYGREYTHLDDVRLRMDSVRDLAEGVKWLHGCGVIDPKRIAVFGRSYGGFMVLSALTTYPELWAAGVDIVGIANFESFLERTGPWRRKLREAEYGSLERDRDFLREISPIHHVDRIAAPLFVVQGANDPRVPAEESEQIVASLRERNSTVEFLLFDDEGHGPVKLKNQLVAYPAIADFLDRHLG